MIRYGMSTPPLTVHVEDGARLHVRRPKERAPDVGINRSLQAMNNPIVPVHAPFASIPRRCPQALAIRRGQNNASLGECTGALRPEGIQSFPVLSIGQYIFGSSRNNSRTCCNATFLSDRLHFCKGPSPFATQNSHCKIGCRSGRRPH